MMSYNLKSSVGSTLAITACWLEDLETLPDRHLARDLALYVEREPSQRKTLQAFFAGERKTGFVGDAVATTKRLPLSTLKATLKEVRRAGVPTAPFAQLRAALATAEEFRVLYESHSYAGLSLESWTHAIKSYCQDAWAAIEAADASFKQWLSAHPRKARSVGITIGGRVFLSMEDVAALAVSTKDAARKLVRVKGIRVYRFGRRKYVLLEDFLAATVSDAPLRPDA